ncbi:MAG: hypothetical protein AB1644_08635 [Candidatus Zixiibacteriota bacterium]
MSTLPVLFHIARADFLERVRRPGFLIVLVLSLYVGYLFAPASNSGYVTVALGNLRGVYNSAWIGAVFSLMSSTFLSLIGFYLVRNAVARDRDTRVAQVLASTRMTGFQYLCGKMLSNFSVLCSVVCALLVSTLVTQLIRAEDVHLNIWHLVAPSLIMALPYLLVVSSIAVLFEVTPGLRGAAGNVAYFFLWNFILVLALLPSGNPNVSLVPMNDPPGITRLFADMIRKATDATGETFTNMSLGVQILDNTRGESTRTFVWNGMDWTSGIILERLVWVVLAMVIVVCATPIFRRFESLTVSPRGRVKRDERESEEPVAIPSVNAHVNLTPLFIACRPKFLSLLRAEVRLALKGVDRWWYLVMAGLIILTLVTPISVARQYFYPLAWIWPVAIWSCLGTRETKHRTEQLIFSAPESLGCQLPAMWVTGALVAAAAGCGMAIRFIVAGELTSVFAWGVGVLFVPTLALAAGVCTGRALLFEALYVVLWYIGPMNQVPFLDFMGATPTVAPTISLAFALITVTLAVAAVAGRKRQMLL